MSHVQARKLAQEIASRYFSEIDVNRTHSENIKNHFRALIQAVTLYIINVNNEFELQQQEETKTIDEAVVIKDFDWREYIITNNNNSKDGVCAARSTNLNSLNAKAYESLTRRTKARLEAFVTGASLCATGEDEELKQTDLKATTLPFAGLQRLNTAAAAPKNPALSPVLSSMNATLSRMSVGKGVKCQQVAEDELLLRSELYIRSVYRAKLLQQECVVAAEPARALKARARSIVVAFVDTVNTVQSQNPVLTRLLKYLTLELLAVEVLSEELFKFIRRIASDYVQSISFASLAFLSSPENSAQRNLTPMILKYLRYLQANWKNSVADCELERMLSLALDPIMRQTFKTIEFRSIGHLLEVCSGFRQGLQNIEISPTMRVQDERLDDNDAVRQALRDLQREVITLNGNILPPVRNRKELIQLLSQTLNSRTLTTLPNKIINKKKNKVKLSDDEKYEERDWESEDFTTTDAESARATPAAVDRRRRRSFRLTTVDFLTKRLLLAASRTGTGGDAYFVVRDLFGGQDVEVVPSKEVYTYGRTVRPGSIEFIVRLSSVTIKCHGSFDVYPKTLLNEVEPLIQVHTTTAETIALQEVRSSDSASENGKSKDDDLDDDSDHNPAMVVQERITDRTGWRSMSVRPALYEKFVEFNTPS
jgi:hypothetical protein